MYAEQLGVTFPHSYNVVVLGLCCYAYTKRIYWKGVVYKTRYVVQTVYTGGKYYSNITC
jgi:hypothetical protein